MERVQHRRLGPVQCERLRPVPDQYDGLQHAGQFVALSQRRAAPDGLVEQLRRQHGRPVRHHGLLRDLRPQLGGGRPLSGHAPRRGEDRLDRLRDEQHSLFSESVTGHSNATSVLAGSNNPNNWKRVGFPTSAAGANTVASALGVLSAATACLPPRRARTSARATGPTATRATSSTRCTTTWAAPTRGIVTTHARPAMSASA